MEFDSKTGFLVFGDVKSSSGDSVFTVDLSENTLNKISLMVKGSGSDRSVKNESAKVFDGNEKPKAETANDAVDDEKRGDGKATYYDEPNQLGQIDTSAISDLGGAYAESINEVRGFMQSALSMATAPLKYIAKMANWIKPKKNNSEEVKQKPTANDSKDSETGGNKEGGKVSAEQKEARNRHRERVKLDKARNRALKSNGSSSLLTVAAALIAARYLAKVLVAVTGIKLALKLLSKVKVPELKRNKNKAGADEKSKRVNKKTNVGVKAAGVVGVALAAKEIYDISTDDSISQGGKDGKSDKITQAVGGVVGGISGMAIGATIGTAILPVVGTAVGGIIGSIAGYFGGDLAGDIAGDAMFSGRKEAVKVANKDSQAVNVTKQSPIDLIQRRELLNRKVEHETIELRKRGGIERDASDNNRDPKDKSISEALSGVLSTDNSDVVMAIEKMNKDVGKKLDKSMKFNLLTVEKQGEIRSSRQALFESEAGRLR